MGVNGPSPTTYDTLSFSDSESNFLSDSARIEDLERVEVEPEDVLASCSDTAANMDAIARAPYSDEPLADESWTHNTHKR